MTQQSELDERRLLEVLKAMGGAASIGELERRLPQHRNTLRRHIKALIDSGLVQESARGKYELADRHTTLGQDAARLVQVLQAQGLDAHLTGFDLLIPYAHQFVFQFPHLIYADPTALEAVEMEIAKNDFSVLRASSSSHITPPDFSKIVLIRAQPGAELYRVHSYIAPVEKAWVDALREARRGVVPIQFTELGRILRSLVDSGVDMRFLRRYARQLGYLDRVEAAMSGANSEESPELQALRAGFEE